MFLPTAAGQPPRKRCRRRILQGLYLLAITGLSVGQELRAVMDIILGFHWTAFRSSQSFMPICQRWGWRLRRRPISSAAAGWRSFAFPTWAAGPAGNWAGRWLNPNGSA